MDVSSMVWTLVDNSKLADRIERLAAIVVKSMIPTSNDLTDSL